MKKFFVFLAVAATALVAFADDCVSVPSGFTGNASITFIRYKNQPLTGAFEINDSHQQVIFAQGNLQYRASTDKWRFAENQYDTIGVGNTHISDSEYEGWIDLFGWGCSGWSNSSKRTAFLPTETSVTNKDYYLNGPSSSGKISIEDGYIQADWAYHNVIINGGNSGGPAAELWRTLTYDEWDYILNSRTDAELKRSIATVCGVHGFIILPDSWDLPDGCSFTEEAETWDTNEYDSSNWEKMEANGAVFLPAAGRRKGTVMSEDANSSGAYWSTTARSTAGAQCFTFFEDGTWAVGGTGPSYFHGVSVRPVKLVE